MHSLLCRKRGQDYLFTRPIRIGTPYVVAALGGDEVLYRSFFFPIKQLPSVKKALPFQLENSLPKPLDAYTLSTQFVKVKGGYYACVHACEKGKIKEVLERFADKGQRPTVLTSVPQALFRFFSKHFPGVNEGLVVDIGEYTTTLIVIQGCLLVFCLTLDKGAASEGEELPFSLKRALYYLKGKYPTVKSVLMTGQQAIMHLELLEGYTVLKTLAIKEAILRGIAYDAFSKNGLQLKVEEEGIQELWKKTKEKALVLVAAACFSWIATFFVFQNTIRGFKDTVDAIGEPIAGTLDQKLASCRASLAVLAKQDQAFGAPPLVTEVLGWLATHPIPFTHFAYHLIPGRPFEAAIALTLAAERGPAEEFHQILLQDPHVDTNPIWENHESHYRTSFIFKNLQ